MDILKEIRRMFGGIKFKQENTTEERKEEVCAPTCVGCDIVGIEESKSNLLLHEDIEKFISWYDLEMIGTIYFKEIRDIEIQEIRTLITQMVEWYKNLHPNSEFSDRETCMNETYPVLSEKGLSSFYDGLSVTGKRIFDEPRFASLIYVDIEKYRTHFHLMPSGYILECEYIRDLPGNNGNRYLPDSLFEGKHIRNAVKRMKDEGIQVGEDTELIKSIRYYDSWRRLKYKFLGAVLYTLVGDGESIDDLLRARRFAQEFNIRSFVVEKILKHKLQEETILRQQLVSILGSEQVHDTIEHEEVKRLRLERKLEKSKRMNTDC